MDCLGSESFTKSMPRTFDRGHSITPDDGLPKRIVELQDELVDRD